MLPSVPERPREGRGHEKSGPKAALSRVVAGSEATRLELSPSADRPRGRVAEDPRATPPERRPRTWCRSVPLEPGAEGEGHRRQQRNGDSETGQLGLHGNTSETSIHQGANVAPRSRLRSRHRVDHTPVVLVCGARRVSAATHHFAGRAALRIGAATCGCSRWSYRAGVRRGLVHGDPTPGITVGRPPRLTHAHLWRRSSTTNTPQRPSSASRRICGSSGSGCSWRWSRCSPSRSRSPRR
jgi:hypothetical protein